MHKQTTFSEKKKTHEKDISVIVAKLIYEVKEN